VAESKTSNRRELATFEDPVFRDLMGFRVREMLLVSSPYDSYALEEDALLGESLDVEYLQLNLSAAPHITRVSTGAEALRALESRHFDLIVTMTRLGEMDVRDFGRAVKDRFPDLPIILLAYSSAEAARLKETSLRNWIDQIFIWRGDVKIFVAIIKYVEDRQNIDRDRELADVQAILLIENSVRFYSSYLPLLYSELMHQNQRVMADGVNAMQRLMRMRARPKILLAETFEEGWQLFEKYRENVLGIISDARFPHAGRIDPEAGLEFVKRVKALDPDMPALIQSSDETLSASASQLGAAFLSKRSPTLHEELRQFIQTSLGFGDFVFILPDGTEVARAPDLAAMAKVLRDVPAESLRYHASRNHFSHWCMARTEFELARQIRPVKVSEFTGIEDLRQYLIGVFSRLRTDTHRGVVAEFSLTEFGDTSGFARIGTGSLGGKGRGLGFANALLSTEPVPAEIQGVRIHVPAAAVIGTQVFDDFISDHELAAIAFSSAPDEEIEAAFLAKRFRAGVAADLRAFVERVRDPIAVRSSSLLEDSYDQPFAGVYLTTMLPNNDPDPKVRYQRLAEAVKLVFASNFYRNAKAYLQSTQNRMEEQKMAVILQKLVGRRHGRYFYPDFAGTACSTNYYPVLETRPEDGVALVALGLGRTVVEGERAVRFCPGRPLSLPQFSTTEATLESAQRQFYALDLEAKAPRDGGRGDSAGSVHLDLDIAERDGTLAPVGATYSPDNDVVYDGISRRGIRLVTFAPLLKHGAFPLPRILSFILELGSRALSCPVEIEFAVNLAPEHGGPPEFALLQIRPMVVHTAAVDLDELRSQLDPAAFLCASSRALGHALTREVRDIVYVRPDRFDRRSTREIASEVGGLNVELVKKGRPYLLIGPGRWGTADPWLGIPVEWNQISGAGTIIETGLKDLPVTPSEGTHFFQNLTSFGVGYFSIPSGDPASFVDFAWLAAQDAARETGFLRHLELEAPIEIRVDGRSGQGLIVKPGSRA
jgi:CheY-like chemotaxis protein